MMGMGSKRCGVILRSGIAIPPYPKREVESCEWLVGGMQSVRAWVFEHIEFDATLRMYGEDVDFYLRAYGLGEIVSSIHLPIKHLNDPSNRDSWREISLYHNGVRWLLAKKYPTKISPIRVIQVAVVLAIGEAAKFVCRRDWKYAAASAGNIEFLYRLWRNVPVVQVIEPR
jgi:GT2 family glycosyltransferase